MLFGVCDIRRDGEREAEELNRSQRIEQGKHGVCDEGTCEEEEEENTKTEVVEGTTTLHMILWNGEQEERGGETCRKHGAAAEEEKKKQEEFEKVRRDETRWRRIVNSSWHVRKHLRRSCCFVMRLQCTFKRSSEVYLGEDAERIKYVRRRRWRRYAMSALRLTAAARMLLAKIRVRDMKKEEERRCAAMIIAEDLQRNLSRCSG